MRQLVNAPPAGGMSPYQRRLSIWTARVSCGRSGTPSRVGDKAVFVAAHHGVMQCRKRLRARVVAMDIAVMDKNVVRIGALELKFLVDDRSSNGSAVVFEMTVPEKARVPAAHHHRDVDEVVYGLEGTLTMTVDGKVHELRTGDGIF